MKKLILVKAGSTAWQNDIKKLDDRRIQGQIPLGLSENDQITLRDCVAATLQLEKIDCIYSSGNESSGPTAEYLAKLCQLKTKKIKELRELDFGAWQGLCISEIKQRFPSAYRQWRDVPTSLAPPQGEPLLDAAERVGKALNTIMKKNRDKIVVIVAGEIVAALIECILTGLSAGQLWSLVDRARTVRILEPVADNTDSNRKAARYSAVECVASENYNDRLSGYTAD